MSLLLLLLISLVDLVELLSGDLFEGLLVSDEEIVFFNGVAWMEISILLKPESIIHFLLMNILTTIWEINDSNIWVESFLLCILLKILKEL